MASLILPVSGPYTGAWASGDLGIMTDDGYILQAVTKAQEINETDAWGLTLLDFVTRGVDWRCRLTGKEWKESLLDILQQFGIVPGETFSPTLDNIGDLASNFAQTLLLTATLNDPPTSPQTLTASYASLSPSNTSDMLLTSKVRDLPLEMVLLPYLVTINAVVQTVPFTTA